MGGSTPGYFRPGIWRCASGYTDAATRLREGYYGMENSAYRSISMVFMDRVSTPAPYIYYIAAYMDMSTNTGTIDRYSLLGIDCKR
jgi:hypothetical protein